MGLRNLLDGVNKCKYYQNKMPSKTHPVSQILLVFVFTVRGMYTVCLLMALFGLDTGLIEFLCVPRIFRQV